MYVVQQAAYPAISPHRGIPPRSPEGPGALEKDKGSIRTYFRKTRTRTVIPPRRKKSA